MSLNNEIVFASSDNINPLLSLFVNNIKLTNQELLDLSSFDAYDKFIGNKYNVLLGTQRDFYRCKNREDNGKMSCSYRILSGFSDLIQYAAIFKSNTDEQNIALKFLEYLVSNNVQFKLTNIGMFPVINQNIYESEDYKKYNLELLNPLKTLNVFYSEETLQNIKNLVKSNVFYGEDNYKEILKFLNW